jgi:hypothetical protein
MWSDVTPVAPITLSALVICGGDLIEDGAHIDEQQRVDVLPSCSLTFPPSCPHQPFERSYDLTNGQTAALRNQFLGWEATTRRLVDELQQDGMHLDIDRA